MPSNGRLTSSELTSIGGGMFLANATARAWAAMSTACKAATGVTMRVTPPYGAYRDLAAQQYMIDHPVGPVPIAPLGQSTHGDGRALDVSNFSLVYNWLRAHAHEFGFSQQFVKEPWHWRHDGTTAAGDGTPIIEKETTMYGIKVTVISKPDPLRGQVPLGAHFIGAGTDPLVWVSNPGPELLAEVKFAEWDTAAVADRINQVGVRGSGKDLNKVYYRFADLLAYEMGGSGAGVSLAEVKAEADRVIAKVPTADENATAVGKLPKPTYTSTPS